MTSEQVEKCKYYDAEAGCRNGKACQKDKDEPKRCLCWLYPHLNCGFYKKD